MTRTTRKGQDRWQANEKSREFVYQCGHPGQVSEHYYDGPALAVSMQEKQLCLDCKEVRI